jgi:ankyrin repeat protein
MRSSFGGDEEESEVEQQHPIFEDIEYGDLESVQQYVLADAGVMEQRESSTSSFSRKTPLMHAIYLNWTAIAHWLLTNRGEHDLETTDDHGATAQHWAARYGRLKAMRALVAAGANPAALTTGGTTPLMEASVHGRTDIVALLLQLPPVKASIDAIAEDYQTALSWASSHGRQTVVQLLLDAGADPTIPAGRFSPLRLAVTHDHHAIAALLRRAIRAWYIHCIFAGIP